jgi:beta-glucosidase
VRLDAPDGPLVATATVPSTGDRYQYTTVTATLRRVSGRRNVYLVPSTGVRLATFSLR